MTTPQVDPAIARKRHKVFYVEDEPGPRATIKVLLGLDYDVIAPEEGTGLIERIVNEDPDLLIIDWILHGWTKPSMNGSDLLRNIVKDKRYNLPPVLFLSAYLATGPKADAEMTRRDLSEYRIPVVEPEPEFQEARKFGYVEYLNKEDINPADTLRLVQRLINLGRMPRESH